MDKLERMHYLIKQLNIASDAYYGGKGEFISNFEWDHMFDELSALERELGIVFSDSPTHDISRSNKDDSVDNTDNKEPHEFPALSLAKTKRVEDLQSWAGNLDIWLSWKLDGLTLVLTYDNGQLTKILTRGNGHTGTNITYMKNSISGFPKKIAYLGHLVVRGEAIISYSDFEYINNLLEDDKYANPRNLASGTLALDETNVNLVKERRVQFIAFSLVYAQNTITSWGSRLDFLDNLGFSTVERTKLKASSLPIVVKQWTERVEAGKLDTPVDGLVISYDDTEYAAGGSVTGHHATRAGLAFKWQDTVAVTMLDHIEWSCASSLITPVAIFEPVQLEGTTVSRASLCNISEIERLGIGANHQTLLKIIKANKIIPKCIGVEQAEGCYQIPTQCPVCRAATEIVVSPDGITKVLRCTNVSCSAKKLRRFTRFVSRKGMDIEGLSIKTLLEFINQGFVSCFEDIFSLSTYRNEICSMDGFGIKSCDNLLRAIEKSRRVKSEQFIYALSIPLIGEDAAKRIVKAIGFDAFCERISQNKGFEDISGIGSERSQAILRWYSVEENRKTFTKLINILQIESEQVAEGNTLRCAGLIFCITGNVSIFENRSNFKAYVEREGGVVTGSVSAKTSFLVNNDFQSTSSKNLKAKKLGVPIISEQDFIEMFGRSD